MRAGFAGRVVVEEFEVFVVVDVLMPVLEVELEVPKPLEVFVPNPPEPLLVPNPEELGDESNPKLDPPKPELVELLSKPEFALFVLLFVVVVDCPPNPPPKPLNPPKSSKPPPNPPKPSEAPILLGVVVTVVIVVVVVIAADLCAKIVFKLAGLSCICCISEGKKQLP